MAWLKSIDGEMVKVRPWQPLFGNSRTMANTKVVEKEKFETKREEGVLKLEDIVENMTNLLL